MATYLTIAFQSIRTRITPIKLNQVLRACCTSYITIKMYWLYLKSWALSSLTHELLHVHGFSSQHQHSIPDLARLQQGLSHTYGVRKIIAKDVWSLSPCALSSSPLEHKTVRLLLRSSCLPGRKRLLLMRIKWFPFLKSTRSRINSLIQGRDQRIRRHCDKLCAICSHLACAPFEQVCLKRLKLRPTLCVLVNGWERKIDW